MLEIGDVVRDIFRALGIPEWEVIGMPVPVEVPDSEVPSRTGEGRSEAAVQGPARACSQAAENGLARGKVRGRRRKVPNGTG